MSAEPTATPTPAPTAVATIPSDQLVVPGKLNVCSDIPYPPLEYLDDQGNPIGSDMEHRGRDRAAARAQARGRQHGLRLHHRGRQRRQVRHHHQRPEHHHRPDRAGRHDPVLPGGPGLRRRQGQPGGHQHRARPLRQEGRRGDRRRPRSSTSRAPTSTRPAAGSRRSAPTPARPLPMRSRSRRTRDAFLALPASQVDAYFADLPVVAYYVQHQPDQFEQSPITAARRRSRPGSASQRATTAVARCRQGGARRDDE